MLIRQAADMLDRSPYSKSFQPGLLCIEALPCPYQGVTASGIDLTDIFDTQVQKSKASES